MVLITMADAKKLTTMSAALKAGGAGFLIDITFNGEVVILGKGRPCNPKGDAKKGQDTVLFEKTNGGKFRIPMSIIANALDTMTTDALFEQKGNIMYVPGIKLHLCSEANKFGIIISNEEISLETA